VIGARGTKKHSKPYAVTMHIEGATALQTAVAGSITGNSAGVMTFRQLATSSHSTLCN
jgi:hypothetical protein